MLGAVAESVMVQYDSNRKWIQCSYRPGLSWGGTGSRSEPGFDSLPFITNQWVRPFLD